MKLLLFSATFLIFVSCGQTGHFTVENSNDSKKKVDIKIIFGGKVVFNDTVYSADKNIVNSFDASVDKGKYAITILADSGKLKITRPIMMDSEVWVKVDFYDKRTSKKQGCIFNVEGIDEYSRKSPDGIDIEISRKEN